MTVIATRVEAGLDIFVHDNNGFIKVVINGKTVEAAFITTENWDLLDFEQKEALLNFYVSIHGG